jgi:hypothetical protein
MPLFLVYLIVDGFTDNTVLEFLTIYGGWSPSRNRVVVPARKATQPGRISSLESILGLLKGLKIRAQESQLICEYVDGKYMEF